MKVIIDRFEGDSAVVEFDGELFSLPRVMVEDAREGDAVMITPLGSNADLFEDDEKPHRVFEHLRRKRRRGRRG